MDQGAMRALADFGRRAEYPFVDRSMYRAKYSRRASMLVRSCNLIPGAMALPVPGETGDDVTWTPIDAVGRRAYRGPVYSLDVEEFHHYVADGLITHNCFYGWVKGNRPPFYGERNQTTVWDLSHDTAAIYRDHPNQKPVELFAIPMRNHTKPGEVCYEPFCGSGSQIIAAEQLQRRVFALEVDPKYADVIVRRYEKHTGKAATLDNDGRTFAEIAAERTSA
jgi:hypothetical protein